MSFSHKHFSLLKDTKLLFQIIIAMRGSNGRGEKNVSQMKSENRRRVNEMEKDKKTNVSEEDVEWKVSVGGKSDAGVASTTMAP